MKIAKERAELLAQDPIKAGVVFCVHRALGVNPRAPEVNMPVTYEDVDVEAISLTNIRIRVKTTDGIRKFKWEFSEEK